MSYGRTSRRLTPELDGGYAPERDRKLRLIGVNRMQSRASEIGHARGDGGHMRGFGEKREITSNMYQINSMHVGSANL